jgi:hypothetical protein
VRDVTDCQAAATTQQPISDTEARARPSLSRRSPRQRVTNDPLVDRGIDGNTIVGRRIRRAWREYLEAMANPTDGLSRRNAADAAFDRIQLEDLKARQLAGESVEEDLIRAQNAFGRSERKLSIKPGGAPQADPTAALRAYLASRGAK